MATKNKMTDLVNHLFAAMERLGDEDLTKEQVEMETKKAKAVSQLSMTVLNAAKVELDYKKAMSEGEIPSSLDFFEGNQNKLLEN